MIRGTTPRHTFSLDFTPPDGSKFRVVYAQGTEYAEKIVLELTTNRCVVSGKTVSVELTRDETLLFDQHPYNKSGRYELYPVKIQIGIETPDGNVLWSNIISTTLDRLLREDGVVDA